MKARCVISGGSPYLTKGKVYEVQVCDFDNNFYKVKNEFGDISMHPTMFFRHLGDEKEIFDIIAYLKRLKQQNQYAACKIG